MTRPGPGKFEANESEEISQFLYDIIGDGMQDDEIGDVESFGWHALITDADKQVDLDHYPLPDVKPAYIVVENSDGFFTYCGFDLNTQARLAWRMLTQEYLELFADESEGVSVL